MLLPTKSHFTVLIVRNIHANCLHGGVSEVLSKLRDQFWLPQARQKIKSILRKCVICKKVQGMPFKRPQMADLPPERILKTKPFEITGIDYTGAIPVKHSNEIIKAYIVLFTCFVCRALHLEVVTSLSEYDFINAYNKFCARRGYPRIVYSDNASYFLSASKTLKSMANNNKFISDYRVEWRFITPRAPWQAGVWERLVGLTKSALKKVVGKSLLSLTELEVLVTQIEAKLNDRPLTYLTDDIRDLISLTPSHLLHGRKICSLPSSFDAEEMEDPSYSISRESSSKRHAFCRKFLNNFWNRWQCEYLTALRERSNALSNRNNFGLC